MRLEAIAVELLAIALSDTIEKSQLSESQLKEIEDFAFERSGNGTDFARAIKAFLGNCLLQRDWNKIDEHLYLHAITEVVGALRGLDRD